MNAEEKKIRNQKMREAAKDKRLTLRQLGIMFNVSPARVKKIIGRSFRTYPSKEEEDRMFNELLAKAESMARKLNRLPTYKELKAIAKPQSIMRTIRDHLMKLGFKGPHHYSNEYVLDHLRELTRKLGRTPGQHDINKDGTVSSTTYSNYFGSTSKAQKAAGLVPTRSGQTFGKNKRLDDEMMLEHLRTLAKELGRSPYMSDINAKGKIDASAYHRHFGGLAKARRKAGLPQPEHGMTFRKRMRAKT